jgi:hypothetical protein
LACSFVLVFPDVEAVHLSINFRLVETGNVGVDFRPLARARVGGAIGVLGDLNHRPPTIGAPWDGTLVLGAQILDRSSKVQCFRGIASQSWRGSAHG